MLNKLLSVPFFIFLMCMPLGIVLILTAIPPFEAWFGMYGEWSFKQWEKKRDELTERWDNGLDEEPH